MFQSLFICLIFFKVVVYLPIDIVQKIAEYLPPSILNQDDEFKWGATPDGGFTSKSAYLVQQEFNGIQRNNDFNHIWKWKGNERIRTFLWKLGHEVLMTNAERLRRTIATSDICPICNLESETLFHRFRDCPSSKEIWNRFRVRKPNFFYNCVNWKDWLTQNLLQKINRGEEHLWSTIFGVTLDTLWRNRNEWVFSQRKASTIESVSKIRNQVEWIEACVLRNEAILPQLLMRVEDLQDKWEPPPIGFFKLNCDGSIRDTGQSAGGGGVLRGSRGEFVFGFSIRLSSKSVLEAELQAILHGIKLAWNRGFSKIIVESDSVLAIDLLRGRRTSDLHLQRLIDEVFEVGDESFKLEWSVVGRRINDVADRLRSAICRC